MKILQEQIELIKRGTELLINEQELIIKINNSKENNKPLIVKLGVDPTAPDIHLGHTVPLRKLKHFQDLGHEVCFLIGDFTGRIGDPSGRDKTRPPLTKEQILENAKTYLEQLTKILDVTKLRVVYNSEWLNYLNFGELIKMAANTTMSKMLEHNTFKQRMESSTSIRMHELLYPFMQGYDSVALKADIELGGSDQTFNLTFGRDLQKFYGQEPQVCITMPILTGTDGVQKMSKSLGNYIGISEPASIMFDKIMRMVDSNITNYYTLLTDVADSVIEKMKVELNNNPSTEYILNCKKQLAFEIIKQYHSEELATIALSEYGNLTKSDLPTMEIKELDVNIAQFLVKNIGIKSITEAKKLIQQGAVSINGEKIELNENILLLKNNDIFKCGKTKMYRIINVVR